MKMNSMEILKTIPFSGLYMWDVKRFVSTNIKSKYNIVVLAEHIIERSEKVKLFEFPDEKFGILGVNNKIGLFDAYEEYGKNINQAYKIVKNNDLAYNPYRINVGSIGWKTENQKYNYISPAYVVFSCHNGLKSEFLYRIFKTETFNKIIKENTTGSVRQNLKFDTLEKIKIPLPPLEEQNRLVANYNAKIELANRLEAKAEELEQEIENYLFEVLGIEKLEEKETKKGLQFVRFKDLFEWNITDINNSKFTSIKYKTTSLNKSKDLVVDIFRGKSPKYDINGDKIILNQKCIRWNEINLEFAKKVNNSWYNTINKDLFTTVNDILINSTGEGTIGRSSLITEKSTGLIYDSHILLLRLNKQKVIPLFFIYLFNSKYGQLQINIIKSAQSTNQTELGIQNLKKIKFPLPPLKIQQEIANHISELKQQIKDLQNRAKENRELAIKEFESEIFLKG